MVHLREKDPEKEYLLVRVTGGEQPGPSFAQKAGQMKIPGKVVGEDIKKLTSKDYKLQKVHVELAVKNRQVELRLAPSTAQILIRELKEIRQVKKKGAEKVDQPHNGTISFGTVLKIVDEIHDDRSRSNNKKGTLNQVLGTALSIGCNIEGHNPKEVTKALKNGKAGLVELFGTISNIPSYIDS